MSKFALISVFNKTNIETIYSKLVGEGYTILSTGGTFKKLLELDPESQNVIEVADYTGFPEVLGGRVKTLHPKIHAGLLARSDQIEELESLDIHRIDVLVCNLYPFASVVADGCNTQTALENIDIGGVTLLRAGAKNYENVIVLCDPADYYSIDVSLIGRRYLASKAFSHVAEYDTAIAEYFGDNSFRRYNPIQKLKYGCNPHQNWASLCTINGSDSPLEILNGNVGYINLLDAFLGYQLVTEASQALDTPVSASYKHTSPAGVGTGRELDPRERIVFGVDDIVLTPTATSFVRARNCDPLSSFGDFIAISHTVDKVTATMIKRQVSDGIIAPDYTAEALEILKTKKNGNYVILKMSTIPSTNVEYREIAGMALGQSRNSATTGLSDLDNVPTRYGIFELAKQDLILANITLKYTQSNSVAYAYGGQVIGIGAGQQNRVDCVKLAGEKARRWVMRFTDVVINYVGNLTGTQSERNNQMYDFIDTLQPQYTLPLAIASDAFFPFPDSIKVASEYGVKYILQPGGSVADAVCIECCDELGIGMAMSNKRMFLH